MGDFLFKTSCPKCHSSDNVVVYREDNGMIHGYCFSPDCDFQFWEKDEEKVKEKYPPVSYSLGKVEGLIPFEYVELTKRGISEEVARAYFYGVGVYKGEPVQVANYLDPDRQIVAQKLRFKDKRFKWVGNTKSEKLLFGQHLWKGEGDMVVITEGEIDALSVAQAFKMRVPVVSIPDGAGSTAKALAQHLDWIEGFNRIVLALDNDNAGEAAAKKAAEILTPGKVYIVNWGQYKDANEVLQAEGEINLKQYILKALPYTPEGVVLGETLDLEFLKAEPDVTSYDIPYPILNSMLHGLHKRELTLVTAGTGVGKSTFVRELAFHLIKTYPDMRIGYIALEENVRRSALGFIALYHNIPLGDLLMNPNLLTDEEYLEAKEKVISRITFYNHFGSLRSEKLIQSIKYMVQGLGCEFIFLDHISIVISGLDVKDERKQIDVLMTRLRSVVEQTEVGMVVLSHLRKYDTSKTAEEGRRIVLDDLRGSGALKQLADNVVALEVLDKDIRQIRVLKNRLFGDIGEADVLVYDRETGRLETYGFTEEF